MWDHIINIHPNELLNTKTKKSRIYIKKKCFTIINKQINMDNLHFILNNILTKFLKELTKYKNDY